MSILPICRLGAGIIVLAAPTLATGQISAFSLRFYGAGTDQNDRVRIPIDDNAPGPNASAPCDVGAGSFTIEFWIRGTLAANATSNAGGDRSFSDFRWIEGNIVVDRDIYGGSEADWGVSVAGGFIRFGTGRGEPVSDSENTIEGNQNVLDNAWHHVAVVRNAAGGVKQIYVDGMLDYASAAGVSDANLSYPNDGVPDQVTPWGPYIVLAAEKHDADPNNYPSFNGYLDEVRIWNIARTGTQIQSAWNRLVPTRTVGLVAMYRFEEGSGNSVSDSSAAGSPPGELRMGVSGNGEWVSHSTSSLNTAPVLAYDLPPDLDGDRDVDLADFGLLSGCMSRAAVPATPACADADFDGDLDVDIDDFAQYQRCSNTTAPSTCWQ